MQPGVVLPIFRAPWALGFAFPVAAEDEDVQQGGRLTIDVPFRSSGGAVRCLAAMRPCALKPLARCRLRNAGQTGPPTAIVWGVSGVACMFSLEK